MIPLTRGAKGIIIATVGIWIVGILILQRMILHSDVLYQIFGMTPSKVLHNFWLWQLGTYSLMHASSVFHVLFNMLVVWFFGSELEAKWGFKNFLMYYFINAIGAAVLYVVCVAIYGALTGNVALLSVPVVGASGACFALLLAYGIIYGDRTVSFMMLFPMKAKYFVMVTGLVEVVTLLDEGASGQVANLAHIGGLLSGYIYLVLWSRLKNQKKKGPRSGGGRRLKLVVNNADREKGPKYWN